jgi:hypothetical protein
MAQEALPHIRNLVAAVSGWFLQGSLAVAAFLLVPMATVFLGKALASLAEQMVVEVQALASVVWRCIE